jgi:hypothetical protein
MVRGALRQSRWSEEKLPSTPKGHRIKVRLALRLRSETTVSYQWIAERLRMGSRSNVSNLVYANNKCKQ